MHRRTALLFCLCLLPINSCNALDRLEHVEAFHDTHDELLSGEMGGRFGWKVTIPEWAVDIRSCTDVDTGEVWVRFEGTTQAPRKVLASCKDVSPDQLVFPRSRWSQRLKWWPRELIDEGQGAGIFGGRTFRCVREIEYGDGHREQITGFLVLQHRTDVAFYWER